MCALNTRRARNTLGFVLAGSTALAWAHAAVAEPTDLPKGEGIELGLRSGYSIPFGKISADHTTNPGDLAGLKVGDVSSGAVPFWIDLGYRAVPELMIGVYAAYAFGILGSTLDNACASGDCATHGIRLGLEGQYHFLPFRRLDPWVGVGLGYEWLGFGFGQSSSVTLSGFEVFNAQAGLDFAGSPRKRAAADTFFALGPFVSLSMAGYSDVSCSGPGTQCAGINNTAFHEWLTFGLRGTVLP